jgi:hypothetical protein
VRFPGRIRHRAFHGSTELLRVECADGLQLFVRTHARECRSDEVELQFSPDDALPVRESDERS